MIHLAFTPNVTHSVFPIQTLANLRFSNISFVANTLSSLTFSDESDFADTIAETPLDYLYPIILHPSVLVPILVISLALILNCCCLKKGFNLRIFDIRNCVGRKAKE